MLLLNRHCVNPAGLPAAAVVFVAAAPADGAAAAADAAAKQIGHIAAGACACCSTVAECQGLLT